MERKYSLPKIRTEAKLSLKLGIPLIVSELIYGLGGFISTLLVARLGKEELAANVLVYPIFWAVTLFFAGILCSVTVLVAQSHGARDKKSIRIITQQGILVSIISSIPMSLFMLLAPKILLLTHQDPTIITLATPLFYSFAWCMLPLMLLFVFEQFLIGIAKTRLAMAMSILIIPLQIASIAFFMFGKYHLGLASAGYGFAASYTISALIVGTYIYFSASCRDYHIFDSLWCFNKRIFTEIICFGLPIGSMLFVELCAFAANSLMVGKFGADALAGHQIAMQCTVFTVNILFGLSQTLGIRIGYEVGQNNRDAIKLAFIVNLMFGFAITFLLAIVYIFFPKSLIALDLHIHAAKVQRTIQYAITFMAIAALLQAVDCCRILTIGALRSLKDTRFPMLMSIIGLLLIGLTASYFFAFVLHLGAIGVWFGTLMGLSTCALILLLRFNRLANTLDLKNLLTKTT